MTTIINEKVSVITVFNHLKKRVMPRRIKWRNRLYEIETIGYHHRLKKGRKLIHIFSVCNRQLAFRLALDTENLGWTLEEVSDGTSA